MVRSAMGTHASSLQPIRVAENAVIFAEEDPSDAIYVIQQGTVRITHKRFGHTTIATLAGPGDFFGELAVVSGRSRQATAEAVSDVSLLRIGATQFKELMTNSPEIAARLIQGLAERLEKANHMNMAFLEPDLKRRLAIGLYLEATTFGEPVAGDVYRIERTPAELAQHFEIPEDTVYLVLQRLARIGIAAEDNGAILLRDTHRLREYIDFLKAAPAEQ